MGVIYNIEEFDEFRVYILDDKYTFYHIDLKDTEEYYEGLFNYFFDEDKLLAYAENKSHLKFSPTKKNFVILYKHLFQYIDEYYDEIDINVIGEEVKKIILDEYETTEEKENALRIRADKKGKIGEYIFSCILKEYFKFDCIIPKVHMSTSRNMSIYGIDALFYCSNNNMLLFGESKLTNSLKNGVSLIKESLKDYEKSISDEFTLTLSSRVLKNELNKFSEIYGDLCEVSIDIKDFISKANITQIGIPIFITHGTEQEINKIINKLSNIEKKDFLGIKTVYYFISLPVINKQKFIALFTKKIKERRDEYESESSN